MAINPFLRVGQQYKKTAQQLHEEDKQKRAKQKPSKSPVRQGGITYQSPNYTGESLTRRNSYEWEKKLLTPLPAKYYGGRSHEKKFNAWAAERGMSPSEAREFRTWMDSKEDKVKTNNTFIKDILSNSDKRELKSSPSIKAIKKKEVEKPKEANKLLKFLDSTLGRASHSMQELVLGKDFVEKQDEVYKRNAETKEKQDRLKAITKKAETKKEKASDITGKVLGFGSYIMPAVAAESAVAKAGNLAKLTKVGSKAAEKLAVKGSEKGLEKIAKHTLNRGAKGAASGALFGVGNEAVRAGFGEEKSMEDRLKTVAIDTAIGGVADPLLHGATSLVSRGWGKLAKGEAPEWTGKPSEHVLDSLVKKPSTTIAEQNTPTYQSIKEALYRKSDLNPLAPVKKEITNTEASLKKIAPAMKGYKKEYEDAVETQYQYLKNSMGKGVQPGGLVRDQEGYVTGSFGRISNNPKWYQDFYAANNRKPNNTELKELAKQHVKEGFEDEAGFIPAWKPKAVQEIDDQIAEFTTMIKQSPEEESALRPVIEALEEDKASLVKTIRDNVGEHDSLNTRLSDLQKSLANPAKKETAFEPIQSEPFGLERIRNPEVAATNQPLKKGVDYEPIESAPVVNGGKLIKVKESNIDHTQGDATTFRSKINTKPKKEDGIFSNLRTQFIDDVAPLENLEKKITGKVASAEDSVYKQARLFKGSAEKAHLIVKEQLVPVINSVKQTKHSIRDLGDYALAVHAKDVNAKGINSGFTNAEIDDVISKLGTPEMEAARKKLVDVNNDVLDILSKGDSAVLDIAQVDAMKEKWPNYMSLFRAFDDDKIDFASGINKALSVASSPIQKLKGSSRDVIDPMESVVKNIFKAVNTADRNKVAHQLGKLADQDTTGQIVRRLAEGEDAGRVNVISAMENGKKVQYEVPPDVYKAMKNLDKESSNTLIKILQAPASLLRGGATLTPEFSLRNPLRDVPNAFIVSESGFNPVIDFPVGLWQAIWKGRKIKIGNKEFTTHGDLYKQFIQENGGYGNIISMDRQLHRETLKKALTDSSTDYIDVLSPKTYVAVMKKVANPLNMLRNIADISETGTKVGEFRAATRKGASPQEAAYRARDIMDFARAGVSIREANKVVAFLNANIQGKSKLYRAFKANPVKVTGKAIASVTIPTIGAIVAQEKYSNAKQRKVLDEAPQWLRDTFYLVPVPGTNQIARIPKPFDLAYPFSNSLERAFDFAKKNDKEAFDGFIKQGFSAMAVPTMLTGVAPIVEGMANYSFFRQGNIIPQRESNIDYPDQYDINTTETAKLLGKGINKLTGGEGAFKNFGSPRIIDNTIQGFTAGLGTYATSAIDSIVDATGLVDEPVKPAKNVDQKPLLKAFLANQNTSASLDKFYTLKEKLSKAKGTAKQNEESFNDEDKLKEFTKVAKEIGDINKEIRSVENSTDYTAEEKRIKINNLISDRNDIARRTVNYYK